MAPSPSRLRFPDACRRRTDLDANRLIDRLLIAALRFYKRWLSPLLGQRCRFVPTCSEYAMTAVERYGALKGSWMAARRIGRCQPFHPGGYDPVPERPGIESNASAKPGPGSEAGHHSDSVSDCDSDCRHH